MGFLPSPSLQAPPYTRKALGGCCERNIEPGDLSPVSQVLLISKA